MKKRTILVVEDDGYIADVLKSLLEANDYRVLSATSGKGALQLAASHVPDVVLLDLGLPDIDGTHVLTSLREWYEGPVIIVSARNQEKEKVQALDMGADDYINKPFSASELLARIRVALRQADKIAASSASPEMSYTVGDLTVDFQNSRVYIAREEVHLTRLEYRIVELLARTPGKVLTHDYSRSSVWGPFATFLPKSAWGTACPMRKAFPGQRKRWTANAEKTPKPSHVTLRLREIFQNATSNWF